MKILGIVAVEGVLLSYMGCEGVFFLKGGTVMAYKSLVYALRAEYLKEQEKEREMVKRVLDSFKMLLTKREVVKAV